MEISWSTFLLEIINFLVLVWILKRFLYRPILAIVEKRRASIEQSLNDAKKMKTDAESVQKQYEGRIEEWESEKQKSREKLQQEIQAERQKLTESLNLEIEAQREKARVIEQRQKTELDETYQKKAITQGARFAARLLQDVASPELEKSLFDLLMNQLEQLPEQETEELARACNPPPESILVVSAFELIDEQKNKLSGCLKNICNSKISIEYQQNSELIAGFHITIGSVAIDINLRDELKGFSKLARNETEA